MPRWCSSASTPPPWAEAGEVLPAVYLPPAGQGDVFRAVMRHAPPERSASSMAGSSMSPRSGTARSLGDVAGRARFRRGQHGRAAGGGTRPFGCRASVGSGRPIATVAGLATTSRSRMTTRSRSSMRRSMPAAGAVRRHGRSAGYAVSRGSRRRHRSRPADALAGDKRLHFPDRSFPASRSCPRRGVAPGCWRTGAAQTGRRAGHAGGDGGPSCRRSAAVPARSSVSNARWCGKVCGRGRRAGRY